MMLATTGYFNLEDAEIPLQMHVYLIAIFISFLKTFFIRETGDVTTNLYLGHNLARHFYKHIPLDSATYIAYI